MSKPWRAILGEGVVRRTPEARAAVSLARHHHPAL